MMMTLTILMDAIFFKTQYWEKGFIKPIKIMTTLDIS
jgi:hypothetical protein